MEPIFPLRDNWAEAGDDERVRSADLPLVGFCWLNDPPPKVPFTGVFLVPKLPWLARLGKTDLLVGNIDDLILP